MARQARRQHRGPDVLTSRNNRPDQSTVLIDIASGDPRSLIQQEYTSTPDGHRAERLSLLRSIDSKDTNSDCAFGTIRHHVKCIPVHD
jgi:hypothetical protein